MPIGDRVIDGSGATPVSLPTGRGLSPRAGPGYIVYRAPKAGTDGLCKIANSTSIERQLTDLGREFAIADFDVSTGGREIIFDRAREESDIVLFELPALKVQ